MRVKEIMSREPVVISYDATLSEASELMQKHGIRRLPVVDREKMVAIITKSDLLRATPPPEQLKPYASVESYFARTKVRDILPAYPRLITINQEAFVEQAAKIIRENKISGLPVVDEEGRLVGVLSVNDILDAFLEILAVNRKGTRLDLKVPSHVSAPLKEIADAAYDLGIKVENVVSIDTEAGVEIIVRVATFDYGPFVKKLEQNGWQVESIIVKK